MTQVEENIRQDRIRDLEFKRQFSLTNIRYLLGEPKPFSETTERSLASNRQTVEQCEAELAELNSVKTETANRGYGSGFLSDWTE